MKKSDLIKIIKEELQNVLKEDITSNTPGVDVTNRWKDPADKAMTGDYKEVKVGDDIKYRGFPGKIIDIYKRGGKTYIKGEFEDGGKKEVIDDIDSRFKSK